MSERSVNMIVLDKGLNLQAPKVTAEAGSVLNSLNYEQVDFQGQKRIDGFVRYDGSLTASIDEYYKLTLRDPAPAYVQGSLIATSKGLLGIVVSVDSDTEVYLAIINRSYYPEIGDSVWKVVDGEPMEEAVVDGIEEGKITDITAEEHYNNLVAFNNYLRSRVEGLPGPIAGLHWFRDRLYAIASATFMSLDGTSPRIFPGDVLECEEGSARVLDAFTLDATRAVFLDAMNPEPWTNPGTEILRDGDSVGQVAPGYEEFPLVDEIATMFQSRTEEQVLREDDMDTGYDFGWRHIPLGWQVYFQNGVTLYGSLPSINQNIEGIGTQGPTSIAGSNGKFLNLTQDKDIVGEKAQVSGWKSSQTPNSYTLLPSNLSDIDEEYIYADAYISWNGDTGQVSAPGITTNAIPQRDATSVVEVVLD